MAPRSPIGAEVEMAASEARDLFREVYEFCGGKPILYEDGRRFRFPPLWYYLGGIRRDGTYYEHTELSSEEHGRELSLVWEKPEDEN